MKIINSTGRIRYCEDCGSRMRPGDWHDCPGEECPDSPDSDDAESVNSEIASYCRDIRE